MSTLFNSDKELYLISIPFTDEFRENWKSAFKNYIIGDWYNAKQLIEKILEVMPLDGPSKTIKNYIESFDFRAPKDY